MISGSMRDVERVYLEDLKTKMSIEESLEQDNDFDCDSSGIDCVALNSKNDVYGKRSNTDFEKYLYGLFWQSPGNSEGVSFFDEKGLMRNYVYLIKKTSPKTGIIMYNNTSFHDHKRKHLNYYFSLNIMAHLFWALFNLFLVLFHSNIAKYRRMFRI